MPKFAAIKQPESLAKMAYEAIRQVHPFRAVENR
jgi:hypothetical protein